MSSCHHAEACHADRTPGWRDPWIWVPASGLVVATAGMWSPHLLGFALREPSLGDSPLASEQVGGWWPYIEQVSALYVGYLRKVAGPLFLGLLLGGLIDHFVPKSYVVALLSGPRKRVVALATVLGVLASACSHGCLALSLELYRKGASTAASLSFLLASPWANFALTLLLIGLFGLRGVVIVAAAMLVALVTGLVFQQLEARRLIAPNPHGAGVNASPSIWSDLVGRIRSRPWSRAQLALDARGVWQGMIPLGRMVVGWVQLGLVFSAVIGAVVPHAAFVRWLGPTPLGLLATLAVAAVLEVCSEGTAPVAFELYRHTGALGNAFAFLVGGVVTDVTELGAVWTVMGRRVVWWMLGIALPLVAVIGIVLNVWR